MLLTLRTYTVKDVVFGLETSLRQGVLHVNIEELRSLLLKDTAVNEVRFDIAKPGTSTRIIHVLDAVEPRCKVGGKARCFPGFIGGQYIVGEGVTHRLAGMAVVTTGSNNMLPSGGETGVLEFNEAVIDMSGIGAEYSACSDTINMCVSITVKDGTSVGQYDDVVRLVALRTADYLARCTEGLPCDDQENINCGVLDPDLPNVAYINQIQSQGEICRTFLYGMPVEGCYTPTLVEPGELMDGAVVSGNYRNFMRYCTYKQQNNPIVRELLDRHGKDLNFVGMILCRGHYDDQAMKARSGNFAAKLAAHLGANACLMTLEGTGNANVDFMATVRALEDHGIAAVPIVHEFGGPFGEDEALFELSPQAVSIVSGGGVDRRFEMPAMKKVIGGDSVRFIYGDQAFTDSDPHAGRTCTAHFFFCGYRMMQDNGFRAYDF